MGGPGSERAGTGLGAGWGMDGRRSRPAATSPAPAAHPLPRCPLPLFPSLSLPTSKKPNRPPPPPACPAARPLAAGDTAICIPEHMCVTLDRIFESEFVGESAAELRGRVEGVGGVGGWLRGVGSLRMGPGAQQASEACAPLRGRPLCAAAPKPTTPLSLPSSPHPPAELLTTDKLSELACLALYLMYEKKIKRKSFWYPYIKVRREREGGAGGGGRDGGGKRGQRETVQRYRWMCRPHPQPTALTTLTTPTLSPDRQPTHTGAGQAARPRPAGCGEPAAVERAGAQHAAAG